MRKGLICLVLAAATSVFTPAFGAGGDLDGKALERAAVKRELAHHLAPIKSDQDLQRLLREDDPVLAPLRALSPAAQARFVRSLRFTERGLASFYYGDFREELTASQSYRLLSLFGAQDSLGAIPGLRAESQADFAVLEYSGQEPVVGDYEGYECVSRATCKMAPLHICIGSNC